VRGSGYFGPADGIRLTPEQIAESAMQEGVHVVGVKKVYTPSDFDFNKIMTEIVDVVAEANHITL